MQIHILIALSASALFHESRATALDLDTASSLLLDVLDVRTTMANNLRTKVEARNGLEIDRDLLFGPFTLIFTLAQAPVSHVGYFSLYQIHLARLVLVLYGGIASRQLG
jgi:hypothetical protein